MKREERAVYNSRISKSESELLSFYDEIEDLDCELSKDIEVYSWDYSTCHQYRSDPCYSFYGEEPYSTFCTSCKNIITIQMASGLIIEEISRLCQHIGRKNVLHKNPLHKMYNFGEF